MMVNKKILSIASLIKNNTNTLIDIGSDHSLLGIFLLKEAKIKKLINIEINNKPLQNGINNLKKHHQFENSINILNDGLLNIVNKDNFFKNNKIDYCVIAGMGTNSIISILKKNEIEINNFIIHSTKNVFKLRKFFLLNNYKIITELYIKDKEVFYPIFKIIKSADIQEYNQEELFFGKKENILNEQVYMEMLLKQKFFLSKKIINEKVSNIIKEEWKFLEKRIGNYENR